MFPRDQRLTQSRLYEQLFRRGARLRGKHISLLYMPAQTGSIGFVITKKVSKSAVVRNRTKRRIRSLVQDLLKQKYPHVLAKYSVAIVIHRTMDTISPADMQTELTGVLDKIPA